MSRKNRIAFFAVALNFIFPPSGYFYLKDPVRFLLCGAAHFIYALVFHFILREFNRAISELAALLLLILLFSSWRMYLVIDTLRISNSINVSRSRQKYEKLFLKPHSFWTLPLYLTLQFSLLYVLFPAYISQIEIFRITTTSMEPSIQSGDYILARKFLPEDRLIRGNIVLFNRPDFQKKRLLLKRIAGLPEETINIKTEYIRYNEIEYAVSRCFVNLTPVALKMTELTPADLQVDQIFPMSPLILEEKTDSAVYHVIEATKESDTGITFDTPLFLSKNSYYLLGDNRDHSRDSRRIGPISFENIRFVYLRTLFSINWKRESCAAIHSVPEENSLKYLYPENWCPDDPLSTILRANVRFQNVLRNAQTIR